MISNLKVKVDAFLNRGGDMDLMEVILVELVHENSADALTLVIKLAGSDHGGETHKDYFQNFAIYSALHWKVLGLESLVKMVVTDSTYRNTLNVIKFLSHIAASKIEHWMYYDFLLKKRSPCKELDPIELNKDEELRFYARAGLIEISQEVEKKYLFPPGLLTGIELAHPDVQSMQFAAVVSRWFHFNKKGLDRFKDEIYSNHSEQVYHETINANRVLIEPFAAQIWSKPRFGEKLVPDFLIRSIDDSYTVIEIEKPSLKIITKNGNLSASATHAKKQVLSYRDWVINNNLYAQTRFKNIWRPYCLVVIGLEEDLDESQKIRLRQENESTQGIVKIVGFDWLYKRAMSMYNNWIQFGFKNLS